LVFGIPGTGKSLIAKTIAKQWDMQLLVMQNVLDKYVGESEKRMKEALSQAEAMAPCVLFIDEIEKFFAGVGGSRDSGVSSRIFGQFLTWMQECQKPVFVVATANNIAALPPELLRKGRFDESFFVDLPGGSDRQEIFKIHLTRKNRNPEDFDLNQLAVATAGYTGSELEQIVIAGLYRAFAQGKDISTDLLIDVTQETPPLSVTMAETISAMRQWGNERARPASSVNEEPERKTNAFISARKIRG
jgi:SpoVK/Ycf46/Vps4 family AAA+-type ATPase